MINNMKIKTVTGLILAIIITAHLSLSQTIVLQNIHMDYSDVLVVINNNSSISDSVGSYFVSMRNIPIENIVRINASTNEEIDSVEFNNIRVQIENHINNNALNTKINYIVTTKGVPLKINRGNTFSTSSPSSSLESELTIILSSMSTQIGKNAYITSPYFLSTQKFSKAAYDMYLVTRLDGYSYTDIKNLIDRSASPVLIDTTAQFVFDQDPTWNSSIPYLNNSMSYASTKLNEKSLKTNLDNTNIYLTHEENVIGYTSWGSNDYNAAQYSQYARPNNVWIPGAIAETYVSTSGRTFSKPVSYGQSVIADLVSEGITGVKGYVYEPYSNAMSVVWVLFDRYSDGFNLAESYYMSSRCLSWMDVVIGDPKMKILTKKTFSENPDLPIQLSSFIGKSVNGKDIQLEWITVSEVNNYGFNIQRFNEVSKVYETIGFVAGRGTTLETHTYEYLDENVEPGETLYRLEQLDNNGLITYYAPITISPNSVKDIDKYSHGYKLYQNYPNPFNPATEIKYFLPQTEKVSLIIYNSVGQEVAELINSQKDAGQYSVPFDGSNLSSGIYFSVLKTENCLITNKMILIK
jgi:uncharacterized protein (TIGR03790 family)